MAQDDTYTRRGEMRKDAEAWNAYLHVVMMRLFYATWAHSEIIAGDIAPNIWTFFYFILHLDFRFCGHRSPLHTEVAGVPRPLLRRKDLPHASHPVAVDLIKPSPEREAGEHMAAPPPRQAPVNPHTSQSSHPWGTTTWWDGQLARYNCLLYDANEAEKPEM